MSRNLKKIYRQSLLIPELSSSENKCRLYLARAATSPPAIF
jgi:hypothetical protein